MPPRSRYGRAEAGVVSYALAMVEIAKACASTAVTMAVTNMVGEVVQTFGSEAQRDEHLPKLTSGEHRTGAVRSETGGVRKTLAAYAAAEPTLHLLVFLGSSSRGDAGGAAAFEIGHVAHPGFDPRPFPELPAAGVRLRKTTVSHPLPASPPRFRAARSGAARRSGRALPVAGSGSGAGPAPTGPAFSGTSRRSRPGPGTTPAGVLPGR